MKKSILTIAMVGALAGSAFAQGTVTFSASTSQGRPVTYSVDGTTKISVPTVANGGVPGAGALNVTAYAAPVGTVLTLNADGTPNLTGWVIATTIDHSIAPSAGNMAAFSLLMDGSLGAPGTTVQMEIVGWTGSFTTFALAQAGGAYIGWSGSTLSGGALGWTQATGTGTSPAALVTGAGGFNGLSLTSAPEPTTLVLGGLGAASLLLFRRRK